jgi:hypothetical protein
MDFPTVEIIPDEELDAAYERAIQSFEANDLKVDRVEYLNQQELPAGSDQFTKMFMVTDGNDAHFFLVCPFAWRKRWASSLINSGTKIGVGMRHDGYTSIFHFLSAYPLPKRIKVFINGPLELLKFWD